MPRVVWVEESKNSFEFEIGPNHDDTGNPAVYILIPTHRILHPQNNNEEHIYTLTDDNRHIPNEKRMTIDVLNLDIKSSSVVAKISNSYYDGNDRHGHVANVPHLLDLNGNIGAPVRGGFRTRELMKLT